MNTFQVQAREILNLRVESVGAHGPMGFTVPASLNEKLAALTKAHYEALEAVLKGLHISNYLGVQEGSDVDEKAYWIKAVPKYRIDAALAKVRRMKEGKTNE